MKCPSVMRDARTKRGRRLRGRMECRRCGASSGISWGIENQGLAVSRAEYCQYSESQHVVVMLSETKELLSALAKKKQIPRCARNDNGGDTLPRWGPACWTPTKTKKRRRFRPGPCGAGTSAESGPRGGARQICSEDWRRGI